MTNESGKIRNRYGVWDAGVGLYRYNARCDNPQAGRFLTQDTYKGSLWQPWTQNLYTYVGNNPVNYVDPTGHMADAGTGGWVVGGPGAGDSIAVGEFVDGVAAGLLAAGAAALDGLLSAISSYSCVGTDPDATMCTAPDGQGGGGTGSGRGNGSDDGGDNGYKPPEGGGGKTDVKQVGGKTITFGHGGRRDLPGVTSDEVNSAIAEKAAGMQLNSGFNKFEMSVGPYRIEVRAYLLNDGTINVGTYIPLGMLPQP